MLASSAVPGNGGPIVAFVALLMVSTIPTFSLKRIRIPTHHVIPTLLGVGLMGTFCEMAWNQGIDLYGYDDNRFLKGAQYVAKWSMGGNVF